jgi:signal transduction histidine kinase
VRRSINVLAAIGALIIVLAFFVLVLALNRIEAPGFNLLHINTRVVKQGVTAIGHLRGDKWVVTGIRSLKSIQILVGCGALLLALRSSLTMWRFVFVSALVGPLLPRIGWGPMLPLRTGSEFLQLVLLVAIFCIAGFRHSRAALWWMWAFSFTPIWLWYRPSWEVAVAATVVLTAVTVAIDALGASQRLRTAQVARSELEEARRAILEERTRIARELHDVVAHHMSLIAVQAETAPYRLSDLTDSALQEFRSVSSQAREALTDMRRLLGVLRDDEPSERAPQPQLTDVPDLVAVTRRVGVRVDLSMPEPQRQVPSGVGLCAYRIVQEALSNACRHAPGSRVSVSVEDTFDALRLQVRNGPGSAHSISVSRRAGHGLAGMRERVAMLGGSLSAQAAPDGGFSVLAVLPFEPLVPTPTP